MRCKIRSRTTFVQVAILAILASASATTGCATSAGTSVPEVQLHRYTSGAEGFDTHSHYIDTGSEVVVFDAQFTPALADALVEHIRQRTQSPITHVVISHPNPDKFNGASVFRSLGAKVVASEATAAALEAVHGYKKYYFVEMAGMFTNDNYPPLAEVDIRFSGSLDLELSGGHRVELRELQHSGVSTNQTVAWIPGANALVVGDLVHHRAHAWLEGGIREGAPAPDLHAWRAALAELLAWEGAVVHGGRGESAEVAEAVAAQTAYLSAMENLVRSYLAALPNPTEALAGAEAGSHFAAIAKQAADAFPQYALAYLVEYGVYGLAQSIAVSLETTEP